MTQRLYRLDVPLVRLIEEQVERTPEAVAVTYRGELVSYASLNAAANRLAHRLVALGVGPDEMVGVSLERSVEMVVALLAVMKAGGAYVPFDPDYPAERLSFMIADSAVRVLLTTKGLAERLPAAPVATIELDTVRRELEALPATNPPERVGPKDLAYTIYTSGSTGKPKGAMNTHEGIVNRLLWMQDEYRLTPEDRVLQKTPFSFDVSVWELFWPLITGARIVVAEPGGHKDPAYLVRTILSEGVTTLHFVPSMLSAFLGAADVERLSCVRQVFCSGEALPHELTRRFFRRMEARLHNLYGPTEAAVDVTYWECLKDAPGNVVPIGRPIANMIVRILDASLNEVPEGESGELHIGGVGLARGYWNRPELTREKFIPDPFGGPGDRLYKTGDLARYLPGGEVEYLGRLDFQVKIRGLRIELGEIEAALLELPAIKEAVVIATEGATGDKQLVAYLTSAGEERPRTNTLRTSLLRTLPDYMVPSAFVFLDALPLSPNGKVDRGALGKGALTRPDLEQMYVAPRRPLEKVLASIWTRLLGLDRVGVRDNFFDVGGNSLLALEVVSALEQREGIRLPVVKAFQYPSIAALVDFIEQRAGGDEELERELARFGPEAKGQAVLGSGDIAIIGMSGRFPGAHDVDELWANLVAGAETTTFFSRAELGPGLDPEITSHPNYVLARGIIPDGDKFDAEFFGINPAEARTIDPQQRVFLELSWAALENAGYAPESYRGLIGVYAGMGNNYYYSLNVATRPELVRMVGPFPIMVGNEKDHIATRVAHKLDLTGPAVSVHTACSTAMTAIDAACWSLTTHQCDIALAGGISLQTPQYSGQLAEEGGVFAKDGRCRPFDADADGTMFSDSAGIVVLKRLADARRDRDTIYAVVKSTAINNDGSDKVSYLAPSLNGQKRVVALALRRAGVSADTIGYVEAHGTATPIGDPIEVEALSQVFRRETDRSQFCGIGSIKSNFGHPTIAAGVAGVIKVALSLKHERIPATLHYRRPNPKIEFEKSPFYVVSQLTPWLRGDAVRRAGVSSFGFGGTNGHAILEEAPLDEASGPSRPRQLLVVSGKTKEALERNAHALAAHLQRHPGESLADAAYTLQVGRTHFSHRRFVVAADAAQAAALLGPLAEGLSGSRTVEQAAPEIVFLFPGQGSQYVGMGLSLYRHEPVFREAIDTCAALLAPHLGCDLREVLYPAVADAEAAERLKNTRYQQPAIFAIEYALAQLWGSWGIVPDLMIGHSIGEIVAATLAEVFTLPDALAIVSERGRLMSELPTGSMLSVRLSAEEMLARMPEGVSLAASNAPAMCVVAGEHAAVAALKEQLEAQGIFCRPLDTSHAFHSAMMDPIVEAFAGVVAEKRRAPPKRPILSTLTTHWVTPADMSEPSYWARHLRSPVRFAEAIAKVLEEPARVLLEVGPGSQASSLARRQIKASMAASAVASMERNDDGEPELAGMLKAVGELWLAGVALEWPRLWASERRSRVPLPTYAFARTRHWVDLVVSSAPAARVTSPEPGEVQFFEGGAGVELAPPVPRRTHREPLLQRLVDLLEGISGAALGDDFDPSRSFASMGLDSLFLTQISYMVQKDLGVRVSFRQLTEEATSLTKLADHIRRSLPDTPATGAPTPVAAPAPTLPPARDVPEDRAATSFPASAFQRSMIELARSGGAPASCSFNESISVTLTGGGFDLVALQRAVAELVARHDALRCVFGPDGSTLEVRPAVVTPLELVELSGDVEQALAARLREDFARPFDLHDGPLVRFHVYRCSDEEHVVVLTSHLAVCDMWSLDVLVRDLGVLYSGASLPAPGSFRDYAREQSAFAATDAYRAMGTFWRERVPRAPAPLDLPLAAPRPPQRTFNGARSDLLLDGGLVRALTTLSGEVGCSLYTVLLGGLALTLAQPAQAPAVTVGMPVAGQALAQRTDLVGSCVRYLPVVAAPRPGQHAPAFLGDLRRDIVEALESWQYDVAELSAGAPPPADPSRVPFLSVCLNLSPTLDARDLHYGDLGVKYQVNPRGFESFELFVNAVLDKGDRLELQIQYNSDLFHATQVEQLKETLAATLARLAELPRRTVDDCLRPPDGKLAAPALRPGDHPSFFGPRRDLFGICGVPRQRSSDRGVLFCYPVGQEGLRSYWSFKLLSNHLVAAGIPVFKFDYYGTGNSLGDASEWSLAEWTDDILVAADELRRLCHVREIAVVGLRFGAVLAARAIERGLSVSDLVLWDPVVSGTSYLAQVRAIHHGLVDELTTTVPFPAKEALSLDRHELAGFHFKPSLDADIAATTLLDKSFSQCGRVSLCVSEDRPEYRALDAAVRARGREGEYRVVDDVGNWDDYRLWDTGLLPSKILEEIRKVIGRDR